MLAIDYASNGACAKAPKLKQLELCSSPSLPWSPSEEFDQLIDSRRTQGRPSLTGEGLGLNVEASFEQGACGDKIPALDQYWFDSLDKSSQDEGSIWEPQHSALTDSPIMSPLYTPAASLGSPAGSNPVPTTPRRSPAYANFTPSPVKVRGIYASGSPSPRKLGSPLYILRTTPSHGFNLTRTFTTTVNTPEPPSPEAKEAKKPVTGTKPRKKAEKAAKGGETPKKIKEVPVLHPPKAALSRWQIFFMDRLLTKRDEIGDGKVDIVDVTKEASKVWANISQDEMESLTRRHKKAKEDYNRDYKQWLKTLTPDAIRQENIYRASQRRQGKSKALNFKDPNAPKKPTNPYMHFLSKARADAGMEQEVFGDVTDFRQRTVVAAAKWRSMTDGEKQPYVVSAEKEKQEYAVKIKEYEERFQSR